MIRLIRNDELNKLLELYLHLHEKEIPDKSEHLMNTWNNICNDPNHYIIVCDENKKLISSCVCMIIPNLTHGIQSYAFIENVVTHKEYRNRGYATACLNYAKEIALKNNCYKMMLLTGSKDESTLEFYKKAGYNCNDKTAFIHWL